VASSLDLFRNGAVGFIEWLDVSVVQQVVKIALQLCGVT
jgi:hypothetical protein